MKKIVAQIFSKKENLTRKNHEWLKYSRVARNQFVRLSEKGLGIPVFTV